jgi:ClpP class serine protease
MDERTPLFHAQNEARYQRQELIERYEAANDCRLVVLIGPIFAGSVTVFEELLVDVGVSPKLHLLLQSPGGDGEAAVRIARSAQARCDEFSVIVPDIAKSAGTLLALGADHIIMGSTSDLGPVDPQIMVKPNAPFVAAKDIIKSVEDAAKAVQEQPDTYALYSALLSDVSALMLQQARSTLARGADLLKEALSSMKSRKPAAVDDLANRLKPLLIDAPNSHGAIFGIKEAAAAGLPVVQLDPQCDQWKLIWVLWTRYFNLAGTNLCFESRRASQIIPNPQG